MNWYRISPCPNYAINEEGQIMNITTKKILNHNSTTTAKDGLKRVTLYYRAFVFNSFRSVKKVFVVNKLKEYIKKENLIKI